MMRSVIAAVLAGTAEGLFCSTAVAVRGAPASSANAPAVADFRSIFLKGTFIVAKCSMVFLIGRARFFVQARRLTLF
jgi:hypothetical protein